MSQQNQTSNFDGGIAGIKLNLSEVLEDIFMVLTGKEKEVVIKRFSLNNQGRQTLEKIGQSFKVTRERIRQIEKIALGKLRRTVDNTRLKQVNGLARELLEIHGGVMLETKIVNEILKLIYSQSEVDKNIIKLALHIDSEMVKVEKTNIFVPFWRLERVSDEEVLDIIKMGIKLLGKNGDVIRVEKLVVDTVQALAIDGKKVSPQLVNSVLEVDKRLKVVDGAYGLTIWRHVNPKSIRDKAHIILKKVNKPLHFIEIANKIAGAGFDKKMVTTQAVHNELIRYDQFVLVGRGLYALKEWGYREGTVSEVIERLLKKKSPMTKQEIIQGVLKQRQVKKGTISLNLQKNLHFVRVGRAVYNLDLSKKK